MMAAVEVNRGPVVTVCAVVLVSLLAALTTLASDVAPFVVAGAAGCLVLAALGSYRTAVLLIIGGFATAPMYRGLESMTGGIPPTDALLVLGLVLLLPTILGNRVQLPLSYTLGVIAVLSLAVVATAVSGDAFGNAFSLVQWTFYLAVLPVAVAWWRPGLSTVVVLLWAYVLGHTVSTVWAAFEGPNFITFRHDGLTHHSNAFGLAGMMTIAILLFLFHHHRDFRVRLLLFAIGLSALVSLEWSGSRAALAVAGAVLLLVPLVERSALWVFLCTAAGALAVIAFPILVELSGEGSAIARLGGEGTATAANESREHGLDLGFERFSESPIIGSGLVEIEFFHNILLEVAVAIGVLGLAAYIVVIATLARPLFTNHPMRRLCYMTWAFMGVSFALPGLWDRTIWVTMSLTILTTLPMRPTDEPEPEPAPEAPPLTRSRGLLPQG